MLQRHPIPLSAIPCLAYSKAIEREKEQLQGSSILLQPVKKDFHSPDTSSGQSDKQAVPAGNGFCRDGPKGDPKAFNVTPIRCDDPVSNAGKGILLPRAKVETANENNTLNSIEPLALREYCQKLFKFKHVSCKRFK